MANSPTLGPSVSPSLPVAIISLAWRSYLRKLRSDPLLTKSLTSALLSVCSDAFSKKLTHSPWKSSTALNELTAGLILRGPLIHFFHTLLDRVIFRHSNQSSVRVILSKLLLDQFLFAPAFTALYFYLRGLAEDRALDATTRKLRVELPGILRKNWSVWIPANLINYWLVPLELRVLYGSCVAVFWNAYLIARVGGERS